MLKIVAAVVLCVLGVSAIGLAALIRKEGAPAAAFAIVGFTLVGLAVSALYLKSAWFMWVLGGAALLGLAAVAFQVIGTIAIVNEMNAKMLRQFGVDEPFPVSMHARRAQVGNLHIYLQKSYDDSECQFFVFSLMNDLTGRPVGVTLASGNPDRSSVSIGGYNIYLESATIKRSTFRRYGEAILRVTVDEATSLTNANFGLIEKFVKTHGDRIPYGSRYNDNPHYVFSGFEVFFDPGFPRPLNRELKADEYNELVVRDWDAEDIYFRAGVHQGRRILEFDMTRQRQIEEYFDRMLELIENHEL